MKPSSPPPTWLYEKPIAHRGLHDLGAGIPENSLKAFHLAVEAGYPIELDIRVCQDDEVIVFHDDTLERACKRKRSSNELTVDELRNPSFRLFGTDEHIPLLREVFHLVRGRVPILIEIKRQPNRRQVNLVIVNTLRKYSGPVAIQSFDPFILSWFRKNAPAFCRGQLSGNFADQKMSGIKRWLLGTMKLNNLSRPSFISYDLQSFPTRSVDTARRNGFLILGWTARSAQEAETAKLHCDNIIFENFAP